MNRYKIFDEFETQSVGVWFFIPDEGEFRTGTPSKGFGSIKYAEGSVYSGEIFYDGKNFNKIGFGKQDFSRSFIGNVISEIGEKKYLFIGNYDYNKTDWIFGNGVLYYNDETGKPTHFKKGFFEGLNKTREYEGEFDYSKLLDGYTAEMEFDYDENAGRLTARWEEILADIRNANKIKTLFIGDSYFELFNMPEYAGKNLFKDNFPNDFINIGVCGSMFADWIEWVEKIKSISAPQKILINLGFNDLHSGRSAKDTYSDCVRLIGLLHGHFAQSSIYLISVVQCPNCAKFVEVENEYNDMICANADINGVTVGEWSSLIKNSGRNCFHRDAIHPNENGYGLFKDFIDDFIKETK